MLKKVLFRVVVVSLTLGLFFFQVNPSYAGTIKVSGPLDSMTVLSNGKTYVTKGYEYVRYSDDNASTVDSGYPLSIEGNWGDLPDSFKSSFDSMAVLPNGKTYVTKGNEYVRYSDSNASTVDPGYPLPIEGNWGDLPDSFKSGFDSMTVMPNGKIYVTKGNEYVRYSDDNASTVDPGYPLPIEGNWGDLPDSFNCGFDSMTVMPNGKIYVTKGNEYVRYSDDNASTVDSGYPLPIEGNWGSFTID